ncbi:MAG: 4Fe-4S binding protein [Nitrospiraceae bacterium]|nr:4Fe-4S binding protein [Nitrospiraceae bacterium]
MEEKKDKKEQKVEEIKAAAMNMGCPVLGALYYVSGFLEGPMCGKCMPCSLGSFEAKRRLENIAGGHGTSADLSALSRIAGDMLEASMCKKGKDTARFLLEWIAADAFRPHLEGICPEGKCEALTEYRVVPQACSMCGLCMDACAHGAILGEKRKPFLSGYSPFEIRQKRCVKCGECLRVCSEGAIEVVDAARK